MGRLRAGSVERDRLDRLHDRVELTPPPARSCRTWCSGRRRSTSRSAGRPSSTSANAVTCATSGPSSRDSGPWRRRGRRPDRGEPAAGPSRTWRAVRGGAIGLAVAVVALGGVALVAFDALFEAFHEVLFPAGSYDFRSGDRAPRPALPVPVLAGDGDRGRHRDPGRLCGRGGGRRSRRRLTRPGDAAAGASSRRPGGTLVTVSADPALLTRRGGPGCRPGGRRPSTANVIAVVEALGRVVAEPVTARYVAAALAELGDGRLRHPVGRHDGRRRGLAGPPGGDGGRPRGRRAGRHGSAGDGRPDRHRARGCRRARTRSFRWRRPRPLDDAGGPVRAGATRPVRCPPPASSTRPCRSAAPSATTGSDLRAGAELLAPGAADQRRRRRAARRGRGRASPGPPSPAGRRAGDRRRGPERRASRSATAGIPDANGPGLRAQVSAAGAEADRSRDRRRRAGRRPRPAAARTRRRRRRADRVRRRVGRPV